MIHWTLRAAHKDLAVPVAIDDLRFLLAICISIIARFSNFQFLALGPSEAR
jgi:hypothetical protein